jgi:hypothetical protein
MTMMPWQSSSRRRYSSISRCTLCIHSLPDPVAYEKRLWVALGGSALLPIVPTCCLSSTASLLFAPTTPTALSCGETHRS